MFVKDISRSEVEGQFFLPVSTGNNDGVLVCTKCTLHCEQHNIHLASSPGFLALEQEYVYVERAWYLFSCDHDVIKMGPKFSKKQCFAHCSINYAFNARCVGQPPNSLMCCKLPATFALFHVRAFGYVHV